MIIVAAFPRPTALLQDKNVKNGGRQQRKKQNQSQRHQVNAT
jgi:hypothetical protein